MRILFSTIGLSDPVSNGYDGPLLHILRYEQDYDEIYLFLSKDIIANHERDNRYILGMKNVLKDRYKEPHLIFKNDLEDVHSFDLLLRLLYIEVYRIFEKYPDAQMDVNISSGTPAMKGALAMLSGFNEQIRAIQVSGPSESIDRSARPEQYGGNKPFTIEDIENNLDNEPDWNQKRLTSENYSSFSLELKKRIIIRMIEKYDYHAAFEIVSTIHKEIQNVIPISTYKAFEFAVKRFELNLKDCKKIQKENSSDPDFKYLLSQSNQQNLMEYYLWLQAKIEKNEYADFVRALSPFIVELFIEMIQKITKVEIKRFLDKKSNMWISSRLDQFKYGSDEDIFRTNTSNDFVMSSQLLAIARKEFASDDQNYTKMSKIRDFEKKIRNQAAHNIINVDAKIIEDETGIKPAELMRMFKDCILACDIIKNEKVFKSYEHMNEILIKKISKVYLLDL